MPNRLSLRPVSTSEATEIRHMAASRVQPARLVQRARVQPARLVQRARVQPARLVQRAQVLAAMLEDPTLSAKEAGLRAGYRSAPSGPKWVRRFNDGGLEALDDRPRSGRPPIHGEAVRSKLLDLALQKPRSLGLPFAMWTLERLQTAFFEREGIPLATSTIWEYVEAEGLRWKRQQSWFYEAEKHDERFAEKRGPSSQPTSVRPRERA